MYIQVAGNEVQINLTGRLYVEEAMRLREQAFQYLDQGYKNVILNFKDVQYIDSSGLGAVISTHKHAIGKGGHVKVKELHGEVKALFLLTKLDYILDLEN